MSSSTIDTITYEDDFTGRDFASQRPHSIDLTLELERQIESESLPTSPVDVVHTHTRSQSLDPEILASIVTQLRLSLGDVTKERDELASLLTEVQTRETGLKDALHQVSEKCIKLEGELTATLDKQKEDQDAITMLRGKVEDSRRALMRLQNESRRMSQASMTIDLSRAGPSTLSGPPSSRRSSFAPLTGSAAGRINAHRRISSVSDSGTYYGEHGQLPGSPRPTSQLEPLHLLSNSAPATSNPPPSNRRVSGFFGRTTPTPDLPPTADASELEELRKELQATKEQLEETRHELTETREAQEASETCVNALRTFIAENSIGMHPPGATGQMPSESVSEPTSSEGASHRNSTSSSRWAFRLWNTPTNTASPNASPALPPPTTSSNSAPPLSRKLGGFFSSRGSISSTSSTPPAPHSHQQEPICNGSDSSSDDSGTEPVSPASELPGSILVHNYDHSLGVVTDSPEHKKTELEAVDLDHGRLVTVS